MFYRRHRLESTDASRVRPRHVDPSRASARRVDRAARTAPRRAAPAHSRSGLGEFAPTRARGSARRTPAPLTPCLRAERAVRSPVDVRAETREARLEVRRHDRAAALEPTRRTRNARNTRWYRPEVVWAFELVSAGSSRLPTEALLNVQAQKHDTRVFLAARSRSKGEVERRRTPLHE